MRILYDGKIYLMQAAGGVNRYFANVINGLPKDVTPYMTTCETRNVNYPAHPNLKVYNFRRFRPAGISYRLEKLFFDYVATSRRYDVAHPTYYSLLTRRGVDEYRCPVVITVWDMITEMFPAELDPHGWNVEEKRKAIMSAQAVICISENTKKDLLERYPIPEDRVTVTHLASEIDAGISHGPEPVPERPFFLYVGLRHGYKNFDGLLAAFANAHSRLSDTVLCVVGAAFTNDEEKQIVSLGLRDAVEYYGHVSDAHLAKLYRCSLAFVYPSFYEGFGIPPLEAMACGSPVIASNRSSVPEVVGDAALLFDPDSTGDLTDILLMLAGDPVQRERLIARGYERAKAFSWTRTAAQTLEIYRGLSAGKSSGD